MACLRLLVEVGPLVYKPLYCPQYVTIYTGFGLTAPDRRWSASVATGGHAGAVTTTWSRVIRAPATKVLVLAANFGSSSRSVFDLVRGLLAPRPRDVVADLWGRPLPTIGNDRIGRLPCRKRCAIQPYTVLVSGHVFGVGGWLWSCRLGLRPDLTGGIAPVVVVVFGCRALVLVVPYRLSGFGGQRLTVHPGDTDLFSSGLSIRRSPRLGTPSCVPCTSWTRRRSGATTPAASTIVGRAARPGTGSNVPFVCGCPISLITPRGMR